MKFIAFILSCLLLSVTTCLGQFVMSNQLACISASISANPTNVTCLTNSDVSFIVTAAGTPTLYYQWRTNTIDVANGNDFSGATASTIWASNAPIGWSNLSFTCYVTNACGSVTSAAAVLTVTNGVPAGECLLWTTPIVQQQTNQDDYTDPSTAFISQAIHNTNDASVTICKVRIWCTSGLGVDTNVVLQIMETNQTVQIGGDATQVLPPAGGWLDFTNFVTAPVIGANSNFFIYMPLQGGAGDIRWRRLTADGYEGTNYSVWYTGNPRAGDATFEIYKQ